MTVGQHDGLLLPAHAVRRIDVDGFRLGEVAVPLARFVLDVARQNAFVGEAGGEAGGVGEVAAAVVAHVDDEAVAGGQVREGFVQIAFADGVGEGGVGDVADVVVQNGIFQSGGDAVVTPQVSFDEAFVVIARVVQIPVPVTGGVRGRVEVHVPVLQLGQHVAQYFEQTVAAHVGGNQRLVFVMDGIPIYLLVVQEAVLLVDDFPESFEVALRGIVEFFFADAARKQDEEGRRQQKRSAEEGGYFHKECFFLLDNR